MESQNNSDFSYSDISCITRPQRWIKMQAPQNCIQHKDNAITAIWLHRDSPVLGLSKAISLLLQAKEVIFLANKIKFTMKVVNVPNSCVSDSLP